MSASAELQSQAAACLVQEDYAEAAAIYEAAIAANPTVVKNYWGLGLALLLQGQEAEAQMVWMSPLMEADPEQAEQGVAELLHLLQAEAERQAEQGAYDVAWLISQHMREFAPESVELLLQTLDLSLKAETFDIEAGLLQLLTAELQSDDRPCFPLDFSRLLSLIPQLLEFESDHPDLYEFLEACIPQAVAQAQTLELVHLLLDQAHRHHQQSCYPIAVRLAKVALEIAPDDNTVLASTVFFMQNGNHASLLESLPLAKQLLARSSSLSEQITVTHYILTSLMMTCRSFEETKQYYQIHKALLESVPDLDPQQAATQFSGKLHQVMAMGMFMNYFEDAPVLHRPIRHQVARACQMELRALLPHQVDRYQSRHSARRTANSKLLKIGYLSDCLRLHSIGWLVRWLLTHHDRDRFEIHLYSTRRSDDPLQQGLMRLYGDRFHLVTSTASEIADCIYQDQIDLLVDLDSITAFGNCAVTALKPAPVQVTWLGYDASGLPAIDYYIADPYVLPESAQSYYVEKIWRLPQTYIAVDGFEVGTPSLRRDQLGIPADAIVYLSSQTGLKRNPDNVRLQLQILKAVPNSYFLIKSFYADRQLLSEFFHQLADEEGVARDRLCFLPDVPDSPTHRANLSLADIVLDTYPYNGATTTLEALWMELPIVTRVGEQFAARNSYTLMINAGIQEGIAWSNQEYVEWGIRLGQDAALRGAISHRLRRSRQTAPLWNAQAFTREMEQAYEQMWQQR